MAAAAAPDTSQIPVHSRRAGNTVHPVSLESQSPAAAAEVKRSKKWFPWLIPTFVVANIVMFIITMYVNNCPKNSISCVAGFLGRFSFQPFRENPLLGPSSSALEKMGALDVGKVVDEHEGWRLITCMWLHGGLFHLLANMLSLIVIGIRLEQEFGFVRIGLLYLISGFGGSLLSALFIQANISVGASGALFGLLGGMLSELITNWTIYANKVAALLTLVIIIAINLAVGILPHVDNFAHIGGFLSGFLLGFVFLIRPQFGWANQRHALAGYTSISETSKFKTYQRVLWLLSLILLVVGFTVGLVLLLRGVDLNDHCSWCHYMSCVPTSRWSCNNQPMSCEAVQTGSQYTLTCSNNGRSRTYDSLVNPTTTQIQGLCVQLCRR
ncbi:rhomboid-like protease 4 [Phtheirospermum japonicum]|uniref:RHOMBOID-like protein n=1 Tax=Phtheirospermum japonicum TaxID=374723 RepID=A0A830BTL1_9LAMI|nr:rhomboid-like protease 4 [Phtheirospermum japonicum]